MDRRWRRHGDDHEEALGAGRRSDEHLGCVVWERILLATDRHAALGLNIHREDFESAESLTCHRPGLARPLAVTSVAETV